LLLSFTLAILVVLIFGVRFLAIARDLPVPVDLLDMARPKGFRALMLGFAALLAPLIAGSFMPEGWTLGGAYLLQLGVIAGVWLFLEIFFRLRRRRPRDRPKAPPG